MGAVGERADRQRNPAPGAVLAGVESLRAQGVRHEPLAFAVPATSVGTLGEGVDDVVIVLSSSSGRIATWVRAASKAGGKTFPRFAARRRIPLQARALKKYRGGTGPASSTSDNEHTLPSLGQSEVLSVKNAVRPPIPELCQSTEKGSESA